MTGGAQNGDGNDGLDPAHKQPLPPEAPRTGQPLPPEAQPVKQPLPPEVVPGGYPLPSGAPPVPSEAPRVKQPLPPEAPRTGPEGPGGDGVSGREWWRAADVRDELRDTWAEHGREGLQAAAEIGAQIGEAVTAALPDPYAAAQRRGLDLRWLRLGVNVPALACSLLVTWGGQSPGDRMYHYAAREGLFALLGWVLLPGLVLAALMALPIGGVLGALVGGLARGITALARWAWAVPYIGYLLRLAVAVAAWSFAVAAGRLMGRTVINWLTGVSS